jgi:hypothetical protein
MSSCFWPHRLIVRLVARLDLAEVYTAQHGKLAKYLGNEAFVLRKLHRSLVTLGTMAGKEIENLASIGNHDRSNHEVFVWADGILRP